MTIHETALALLTIVTIVFAIARFLVPFGLTTYPGVAYRWLLNLWVGFLFGAAYGTTGYVPREDGGFELVFTGELWALAIVLPLIEIVAFSIDCFADVPTSRTKGGAA